MSSRHLIDPELAEGLEKLPPFASIGPDTLPAMRENMRALAKLQIETTDSTGVTMSERSIPGPKGAPDVRVVIYTPTEAKGPLPAYLHMHGGGMILGIPEIRHASSLEVARDTPCVVVSVDYRLAPETPSPGAVEDCYAALKWLAGAAKELNIDPKRIAIGGESAGGGLAAALGLLARDRKEITPAFQLLIYPMLDDRTVKHTEARPYSGEFVWTPKNNVFGWQSHLGQAPGGDGVSPYAAAARAENLVGLPPTYISVGSIDLFADENIEYARRLVHAGVPVEFHLYPGAFHAFDMMANASVAKAFKRDWRTALKRALNP
jgi:acetyl esterase/lipase